MCTVQEEGSFFFPYIRNFRWGFERDDVVKDMWLWSSPVGYYQLLVTCFSYIRHRGIGLRYHK